MRRERGEHSREGGASFSRFKSRKASGEWLDRLRRGMNSKLEHIPVLGMEAIKNAVKDPNGVYVDATFGAGGHSKMILKALGPNGKLISFDVDDDAVMRGRELEKKDSRFHMAKCNFANMQTYLSERGIEKVDGMIFDLGLNTHQLLSSERGFSFKYDEAPLDMRMDKSGYTTAADFLNKSPREKLSQTFKRYGNINNPSKLVNNISMFRKQYGSIDTVGDFLAVIERSWDQRTDLIKFVRQCFQAIRIEVNREMDALESALESLQKIVKKNGVVVIITFHSLEEDKIRSFKRTYCDNISIPDYGKNFPNQFSLVTQGCIFPSELEKMEN